MSTKKGFTLIELLTVVAIIALLASASLASLAVAQRKSRDAKRISDLHQMQIALEYYYASQNPKTYPVQSPGAIPALLAPVYLESIRLNPIK